MLRVPFRNYVYVSLGLNLLTALGVILIKGSLPPVVPLFYGKPLGEGQLIPTLGLLVAPGVSTLITLVNVVLGLAIKDDFLKKILISSAFLVSMLTTITVVKIVSLVGFF